MCELLTTHLFSIGEVDGEMSIWFRKGKSAPNIQKCLHVGRAARERFDLLTLIPPLPKEKVFDLSIANLGRKSHGNMIAFSETFHKSTFVIHFLHPLNCLKFNILIKFLKF